MDGAVLIWWGGECGGCSEWAVPVMGVGGDGWVWVGRAVREVSCHLWELPENGVDTAHFPHVHGHFVLPLPHVRHQWRSTWTPSPPPQSHLAQLTIDSTVSVGPYSLPFTRLSSSITQVGPALVQIRIHTRWGVVVMQETVLPLAPSLQRACHVWWCEVSVPLVVAKVVAMSAQRQFDRDLPIWHRKRMLRRPLVLREDGAILAFRRWMKQFYPQESREREGERVRKAAGDTEVMKPSQ